MLMVEREKLFFLSLLKENLELGIALVILLYLK